MPSQESSADQAMTPEAADVLQTLDKHRSFVVQTVRGLTDDQARARTTVSELCLGGIIKHVTLVEQRWADFIERGPSPTSPERQAQHAASFVMTPDDTLDGLLASYQAAADRTDALASGTDLDSSQPLPAAPWFEPGAKWTARRVLLHVLAETSQHAGHADIIREALDGAKTMG